MSRIRQRVWVLVFFAFFLATGGNGYTANFLRDQQSVDSLEARLPSLARDEAGEAYLKLANFYRERNCNLSRDYSLKLIEFLKSIWHSTKNKEKLTELVAAAYYNLGYCERIQGNFLAALENLHLAGQRFSRKTDLAKVKQQIGFCYRQLGYFEDALPCFEEALDILENENDEELREQLAGNVAEILFLMGKYDLALAKYLEIADKLAERSAFHHLAEVQLKTGAVWQKLGNSSEAEVLFSAVLNNADADSQLKAEAYYHLGVLLHERKENRSAEEFLLKALNLMNAVANTAGSAKTLNELVAGKLEILPLSEPRRIMALADSALVLALKSGQSELIFKAYENIMLLKKRANDPQAQYQAAKKYYALKDSLQNLGLENSLKEVEAILNHKNKLVQISILEKQNAQKVILLHRAVVNNIILIVALTIFLMLGLFIYYNYHQKKRDLKSIKKINANIEEETEQIKKKIEELNYFKNNLTQQFEDTIAEVRNRDSILIIQSRYVALSDMIDNISLKWKIDLKEIQKHLSILNDRFQKADLNADILKQVVNSCMDILYDMSQKIDDFRDFFRPQAIPRQFYPVEIIHKTISFVRDYYEKQNINLQFTAQEQDITLEGYPNELSQVILNILDNAQDAFKEKNVAQPEIRLSLRREAGSIVLEISDNGGGVPENLLSSVFEPFVSSHKEAGSTGLGLYIAREVISSRFKGSISLRNEKGGAVVKITF